ncbi:hypothetical protein ACSHWG_03595 [Leucobacter sp. Z1108]|uniref:hypothetical protein n=1 Tax=Leucobacter sp. Z1108 TaxID=3439066 RepID=UPI003F30F78E
MVKGMNVARLALAISAVSLVASASACAAEPAAQEAAPYKAPTMAPEQSVSEACGLSRDEVDRLVVMAEESVKAGLEEAGKDLLRGEMPSFGFLTQSLSGSFELTQETITNSEVSAAIGRITDGFTGFQDIEQPGSILGVPAYLAALNGQLAALTEAGQDLRTLCNFQ